MIARLVFLLVSSIVGVALVLFATARYGAGLTTDAVGYILAARDILSPRGLEPLFVLQPPLYPALLAALALIFQTDPLNFAHILNALLFGIILFESGWLFFRALPHFPALAVLGTLTVLVSRPLLGVSTDAFSESLFIVLTLTALLALDYFLETNRARWFILLILTAALSCVTRYIGVTVILTAALALLLAQPRPRKTRLATSALFTALSLAPFILWSLRNYATSGTFFGPRSPAAHTLLENLEQTAQTFLIWFSPLALPSPLAVLLAILLIIALVAFTLYLLSHSPPLTPVVFVSALFSLIYLAFLLITATTTAYNDIGSRFLAPILVPLLLTVLWLADHALAPVRSKFSPRLINAALLVVLALLLIYPILFNTREISRARAQGAGGYNTTQWRENQTLAYLRAHRDELTGALYSNAPDATYILADTRTEMIPAHYAYASTQILNTLDGLRGSFPPAPSYLIWLSPVRRDQYYFSLRELKQIARFQPLQEFPDGAIYHISPR